MVLDEFNLFRSAIAMLLCVCVWILSFYHLHQIGKKNFFFCSTIVGTAHNILALFSGIAFKYHWEFISYDFFFLFCVLCCWCYFWFIRLLLPRLTRSSNEKMQNRVAEPLFLYDLFKEHTKPILPAFFSFSFCLFLSLFTFSLSLAQIETTFYAKQ